MTKFESDWLEDRSDEGVLAEMRRVAALFPGLCLTIGAFDSKSKMSASAVSRRFGSWSEAKRRAGLADAQPEYSDDAILEDLRRVSASFPNAPFTQNAYVAQGGRYSRESVGRRFGGWREALEAAGIGGRFSGHPTTDRMRSQPGRSMNNEDILIRIREVAAGLGRTSLAGSDIAANSEINDRLLRSRFGSASEAFRQAGVQQVSHGHRHTEEEVFENLLRVWTHYGRPPTASEMDKPPSTVGKGAYISRYGGWRKALNTFMARANTGPDGDRALIPGPSTSMDRTGPTPRFTSSAAARTTSQALVRPRATRLVRETISPADRRIANIGLRFKVLQRDHFRCRLCGRSPATELDCSLHVDHVIPFSKGGKTTIDNLQTLCSHCNVGKSNHSA